MNKKGNPNIAKLAKPFTKGDNRASEAGKKGAEATNKANAIRHHLRKLGKFEPDVDNDGKPLITMRALKAAFRTETRGNRKARNLNMAEIWSIIHAQQAGQNFKAMISLIENHDGKQVESHLHKTTKSFAELVNAAAGNAPAKADDDADE